MTKPNKRIYIDFILNQLKNGKVGFNDVLLPFKTKFNLTKPTFSRYWKEANEEHKNYLLKKNERKSEGLIDKEIKEERVLLLDKIGRMQIAEEIAMGKAKKIDGQIIMPSFAERLKALEYLSKIEGDFAAVKTDLNITKEYDIYELFGKAINMTTGEITEYEEIESKLLDRGE